MIADLCYTVKPFEFGEGNQPVNVDVDTSYCKRCPLCPTPGDNGNGADSRRPIDPLARRAPLAIKKKI